MVSSMLFIKCWKTAEKKVDYYYSIIMAQLAKNGKNRNLFEHLSDTLQAKPVYPNSGNINFSAFRVG